MLFRSKKSYEHDQKPGKICAPDNGEFDRCQWEDGRQIAAAVDAISASNTQYCTYFDYPDEIHKAIYTTNAIESLNSVIRKAIKNRKIFPNDNSVYKVIYLAMLQASQKWTMPIRNWKPVLNRFSIELDDRVPPLR